MATAAQAIHGGLLRRPFGTVNASFAQSRVKDALGGRTPKSKPAPVVRRVPKSQQKTHTAKGRCPAPKSIEVTSLDIASLPLDGSSPVLYEMEVRMRVAGGTIKWTSRQRYSDFESLDNTLRHGGRAYPLTPPFALPQKHLDRSLPNLRSRAVGLLAYIRGVLLISPPDVYALPAVVSFLGLDAHSDARSHHAAAATTLQGAGRAWLRMRAAQRQQVRRAASRTSMPSGWAILSGVLALTSLLVSLRRPGSDSSEPAVLLYERRHELPLRGLEASHSFWVDEQSCLEMLSLSLPRGLRLHALLEPPTTTRLPARGASLAGEDGEGRLMLAEAGDVFFGPIHLHLHLATDDSADLADLELLLTSAPWAAHTRLVTRFERADALHEPQHPLLSHVHPLPAAGPRLLGLPSSDARPTHEPAATQRRALARLRALAEQQQHRRRTRTASALLDSLRALLPMTSERCEQSSPALRACARLRHAPREAFDTSRSHEGARDARVAALLDNESGSVRQAVVQDSLLDTFDGDNGEGAFHGYERSSVAGKELYAVCATLLSTCGPTAHGGA